MTTKFDIFSGGLVGLFLHEEVTNTDLDSESYLEIPECAAFPETGVERSTVDVPNFGGPYNRKLVGRMSVPDIELSINYMPGNEVHEKLIKATEDGKRVQIKIAYYIDATKKSGV
ncbi:hypothetical protein, partial [Escherichia coli]